MQSRDKNKEWDGRPSKLSGRKIKTLDAFVGTDFVITDYPPVLPEAGNYFFEALMAGFKKLINRKQ